MDRCSALERYAQRLLEGFSSCTTEARKAVYILGIISLLRNNSDVEFSSKAKLRQILRDQKDQKSSPKKIIKNVLSKKRLIVYKLKNGDGEEKNMKNKLDDKEEKNTLEGGGNKVILEGNEDRNSNNNDNNGNYTDVWFEESKNSINNNIDIKNENVTDFGKKGSTKDIASNNENENKDNSIENVTPSPISSNSTIIKNNAKEEREEMELTNKENKTETIINSVTSNDKEDKITNNYYNGEVEHLSTNSISENKKDTQVLNNNQEIQKKDDSVMGSSKSESDLSGISSDESKNNETNSQITEKYESTNIGGEKKSGYKDFVHRHVRGSNYSITNSSHIKSGDNI